MNAAEIRDLYPITRKRAYMFSGGIAPVSTRHEAAMKAHMDWLSNDPDDMYANGLDADASDCRRMFAELMGCDEDEVAVVNSTSEGSAVSIDVIEPRPWGERRVRRLLISVVGLPVAPAPASGRDQALCARARGCDAP